MPPRSKKSLPRLPNRQSIARPDSALEPTLSISSLEEGRYGSGVFFRVVAPQAFGCGQVASRPLRPSI